MWVRRRWRPHAPSPPAAGLTPGLTWAELARLQRELFAARTTVNQAAASSRQALAGPALDDAIASLSTTP
jgi:hypothetical protein